MKLTNRSAVLRDVVGKRSVFRTFIALGLIFVSVDVVAETPSSVEPSAASETVGSIATGDLETSSPKTPESETESAVADTGEPDATPEVAPVDEGSKTPPPSEEASEGASVEAHEAVSMDEPVAAAAPPPPTPVTRSGPRRMMLLVGPGFGFGFMYPREINDYLEYWADSRSADIEEGSSAMFLSFQPKLAITFAPIEYVQLQFVGEVGWAPKIFAVIGGDSEVFHFLRYTTGLNISGHIPISNGRRSISFGAGALFNVLKFEGEQEIAPGIRGLFGFRFYGRRAFTPEIFAEFSWIRAATGRDPGKNDAAVIGELNYSCFTIGGNFYFKVLEK